VFGYHLKTALLSIRRNPVLAGLMVVTIGLGITVFLSLYTGYHLLMQNPLPQKGEKVYRALVDSWDVGPSVMSGVGEPNKLMTWIDATNLRRSEIPTYHSPMYMGRTYVHPDRSPDTLVPGREQLPQRQNTRLTYNDFFPMFDVPFLYGGPWSESADADAEQVVVLSRKFNEEMFDGEDSVGRRLFIDKSLYTVVGVLDEWRPVPLFYNILGVGLGTNEPEPLFLPFMLGDVNQWRVSGMNMGWKPYEGTSWEAYLASEQTWLQYWAQLDTLEQKQSFQDFIDAYTAEQKEMGRFPRDPLNNQLLDVPTWIKSATSSISGVAIGFLTLGGLFLLICVTNLISMLLGKFLETNRETALRRALGATRAAIFSQRLIEVGLLGVGGGLLGIALTQTLLLVLRANLEIPAVFTRLDVHLFGVALSLALVAGIAAGLLPAWRACRVPPANHLNT
jgi:putative ABC transport system permease protein